MPNCVALTRIGDDKPSTYHQVDDCLCQHFEVDGDPNQWFRGWYDYVAFLLAIGCTWDEIVDELHKVMTKPWTQDTAWAWHMIAIVHYLRQHYTADTWWEPKS